MGNWEDWVILDFMDYFFYPREDTLKVCVDIFIRSVSGMQVQDWGYSEDIYGS